MGNLHQEILDDISDIMLEFGSPVFTWPEIGGTEYGCIASISQFNRVLEMGGFSTDLLLVMTVPRYDLDGNTTFPNDILPEPQQRIIFNNLLFRIEIVKQDSIFNINERGEKDSDTGARIRITAMSITKGV